MKRKLFSELSEGFEALTAERLGKITLKRHRVEAKPAPEVSADEVLVLRKKLNLSRAVFARYLRINERTLENWEPVSYTHLDVYKRQTLLCPKTTSKSDLKAPFVERFQVAF